MSETLPDSERPHLPACTACARCCFSATETYVQLTGVDWSRLGDEVEKWAHFIGNRVFMRMQQGRCAALEMKTVAHDGAERTEFFCRIYERRPQICRDLDRGSPQCEAERWRKPEVI